MNYPGDQSQQIEDYLRAKGNDGYKVSSDAYKAALRIAALAIEAANKLNNGETLDQFADRIIKDTK